jgi:ribosomal protein S18 acetylase RimI-like enzyme
MQIRLANPSDSSAIGELHAASWRHTYREALSDSYLAGDVVSERKRLWEARLSQPAAHQHVLLAHAGKLLAGFACVYGAEHEQWGSYLNNIHVAQAMHGKGLGNALLHAAASLCLGSYGEGSMYIWVLQSNEKAQRFYAKSGAHAVGVDTWQAPDGSSAPLYRFSWPSLVALQAATANPSVRGTSCAKAQAAPYVER